MRGNQLIFKAIEYYNTINN